MIVVMGSALTVSNTRPETEQSPARPVDRLRVLVDEHIDAIARTLRRLGVHEADVDDAVQQVFLTASRRLADIEVHAEKSFLYKTALHVAAHARRTIARRREAGADEAFSCVDDAPSAEELVDQQRAAIMLDEVLDAMPPELRVTFVLFEVEQLPVAEIAALLEIPLGTASSRLRRAREDFQERVERLRVRSRASQKSSGGKS